MRELRFTARKQNYRCVPTNLEVFQPSDNHDTVQFTAVLRHDRVAQESQINKSEQKHCEVSTKALG